MTFSAISNWRLADAKTTRVLLNILLGSLILLVLSVAAFFILGNYYQRSLAKHADIVLSNVDRAVIVAGVSFTGIQKAEKEQLELLSQSQKKTSVILDSLNRAIEQLIVLEAGLNKNINEQALPELTSTLTTAKDTLSEAQKQIHSLGTVTADVDNTLVTFNTQTLPKVNNLINQANLATVQVTATADQARQAAGHVNNTTEILEKEARKLTKPKTIAMRIVGYVIGFTTHFAADLVAFKIYKP